MTDNQEPTKRNQRDDDSTKENYTERTRSLDMASLTGETDGLSPVDVQRRGSGESHVQPTIKPTIPPPTSAQPQPPVRVRRRAARQRQQARNDSSLYLPWWSLAVMMVAVGVVAFGLIGVVYLLGNPTGLVDSEPTPIITIVPFQSEVDLAPQTVNEPTAQAPATQIILGGQASTQQLALSGPTLPAVVFTPTPISITVGRQIAVDGVDENQLNVRDDVSLNSNILFRADEEELFTIVDGPRQGAGFTWWRIQDPLNPNRAGWAVSNYLQVVPD